MNYIFSCDVTASKYSYILFPGSLAGRTVSLMDVPVPVLVGLAFFFFLKLSIFV